MKTLPHVILLYYMYICSRVPSKNEPSHFLCFHLLILSNFYVKAQRESKSIKIKIFSKFIFFVKIISNQGNEDVFSSDWTLDNNLQNHFSHYHHHKYIHHEYIHHHIIPPTTITSPSSLFTYNINEDFEEPAAAVVVKAPLLLIAEDLFGMNILLLDCNEIEVIDTFCMYTESEQRRRTQTLSGSRRSMS